MRALITGAGGFVGGHLTTFLCRETPFELHGTVLNGENRPELAALGMALHTIDLRDSDAVRRLLADVRPDRIYHLAGQAYVPRSFEAPWETLEINVRGPLNVLQALHDLNLTDTRILVVGSAEMYGLVRPEQLPLTEAASFAPPSPYSVSKIAQDMLALQFHLSYQMFTVRMRPFNHIGPGQNIRFAVSAFASQIAQIELGLTEPVVYVGDLSAERDFTDVRDIVRAYYLALERGEPGAAYNVCSGVAHKMSAVLDRLIALSAVPIKVAIDPARLRPVEIPCLVGDFSALRQQTGWQPQIAFDQTLQDVLTDWRQRLRAPQTDPQTP